MRRPAAPDWGEYAARAAEWWEAAVRVAADVRAVCVEKYQRLAHHVRVHNIDESEDDLQSMVYLAPLSERIKDDETISKLCQEGWQGRHFVLTKLNIFLSHPGIETVSEKIPLHEIKTVKKFSEDDENQLESVEDEMDFSFVLQTNPGGYTNGREYCFRVATQASCDEMIELITTLALAAAKEVGLQLLIDGWKGKARDLLQSRVWQTVVSCLIAGNFAMNLAQSSATPTDGSTSAQLFSVLDIIFTTVFAIELAVNLFGNWFWPFATDGWSVFDFVVVTVSIASLVLPQAPGVSILRLMRTFRILRLFKKLRSLRTIMNSLAISMYPVFNAFLIVGLVLFVYAILGVQQFSQVAPDDFGSFAASVWTMFRVSTFDGWSAIFNLISTKAETSRLGPDAAPALFMGSFIVVLTWILQPLVMAVLLDNFVQAVKTEKQKHMIEMEEKARQKALLLKPESSQQGTQRGMQSQRQSQGNPLTPLLESLSRFKDSDDLSRRIQDVFKILDVDMGGTISFEEMREGLRKMNFQPPIDLESDFFSVLTRRGALCDAAGNLSPQNFESMLYAEVQQFTYNKVAQAFEEVTSRAGNMENSAVLASLKWLMMRDETNGFGASTSSKAKRKPFDIQDFIDSCRKLTAWQDEVKHVREVERLLRKDLEDMRSANLDLSSMLRKELQDISRDMLSLRQDLHLHLKRSEIHPKYSTAAARDSADEPSIPEIGSQQGLAESVNQLMPRS